jgi:RHS repeat-associated protein
MTSDGTHGYTWDARNRLSQMDLGNTASFVYDPFGRRTSKTVVGTQTGFLYDGANPVQELSGATATANLLSGGLDEIFQRTDSAGARSFLTDALGSTLALTDASAAVQTSYTFDPFGNTTSTGAASTNSFQYTGRELDGTGLYFYRARYYNPAIGRFISEDPIEFEAGSPNFYAYVGNDPIDGIDPFGLKCITKIMLVTAYSDPGPGKDWPFFAPKRRGGKPTGAGPGIVAVANTNPPPYPFGSSVSVSGSSDPFGDSPFGPAYDGTVHDTGAGWNPSHHNVSPDDWIDIWLPHKQAIKWGKQWRKVTICTPDSCKANLFDTYKFGGNAFE